MLPIFKLTRPLDKTYEKSDTKYTNIRTYQLDLLVVEYVFIEIIHSFG